MKNYSVIIGDADIREAADLDLSAHDILRKRFKKDFGLDFESADFFDENRFRYEVSHDNEQMRVTYLGVS